MQFDFESLGGCVSFISGPEKNCGKTTFMVAALEGWRRRHPERPPALLTVGYDGETRDLLSGVRKPAVPVMAGDYFVTVERFLRGSGSAPEIVDLVPGTTALGRCCIARAARPGAVALVGPENNRAVAEAIRRLRELTPHSPVLVDGAINRITQLASVDGARLVYLIRIDRSNLARSLDRLDRLGLLLRLPALAEVPAASGLSAETAAVWNMEGALTAETLQTVPPDRKTLVVDDFTKIFLGTQELRAALRARSILVRRPIACSAIVAVTRGVAFEELARRLDDPWFGGLLRDNPHLQENIMDSGVVNAGG